MNLSGIKEPTRVNLLVSFFDLTGFVKLSKQKSEEELFFFMSEFFNQSGKIIEDAGGKVIKFIGDAGLVVFPEELASTGILTLKNLKVEIESWLQSQGLSNKLYLKIHFGTVICGTIGSPNHKNFDVFGQTINTTATLASNGFSLSPQAFRKLDSESRKHFKKHTPPIRYIPVEERH